MKVEKLTVGKGITSRLGPEELWTREHYGITVFIEDPSELEVAKANLTGLIDGWLSASKRTAAGSIQIPQLDPDQLARLPWKNYKTKEPSKPDGTGWIFCNTPGAEALADLIEKQGKNVRVQIGQHTFEVRFSGAEKQFIGRAPVKKQ